MTINALTFTTPAIVVGVTIYTKWENGKDTETPEGTRVDVLVEDGFDRIRISVKIPILTLPITQAQVTASKASHVPITVLFDDLEITPYISKSGTQAFSARASKLKVVDNKKGFPDTPIAAAK